MAITRMGGELCARVCARARVYVCACVRVLVHFI
jgi:hypothetical protein